MNYQKSTIIKIGNESFELNYPSVGQQLEIENLKNVLSAGKYAEIANVGNKTGMQLLDLIDAVSYFSVLSPVLKKKFDLTVENFSKMNVLVQRKLSKAFVQFYNNFILKVEQEINKILDSEELEKEEPIEESSDESIHSTGL